MKKLLLSLVIALSLSGCFTESSDETDNIENSSSSIDSSSSENSSSSQISSSSIEVKESLYFVGSDYSTGLLYELNYKESSVNSVAQISQDSKLINTSKGLVVLERTDADNILLFDTKKNKVIYQVAIESGSNPSDLVEYESNGIISLYNGAKLLRIDLATGDSIGELDLSTYSAEGSTTPNINDLELHDGKLYVSLQRLDASWVPQEAMILVVDAIDFDIIDTITTEGKNPSQIFVNENSLIVVFDGTTVYDVNWNSTSGNDGYIASFNLDDYTETTIINENDLSAKPKKLLIDNNTWYLAYSANFGSQPLAILDSKTKTVKDIDGVVNASGGLSIFNSTLIIGERETGKETIKVLNDDVIVSIEGDYLAPYSIQVLK